MLERFTMSDAALIEIVNQVCGTILVMFMVYMFWRNQ